MSTTDTTATEPTETEDTTAKTAEEAETTTDTTAESTTGPEEDEAGDDSKAGRQAARYRTRLREAEAELETARATVAGLRRTLAEGALADRLAKPEALWMTGAKIEDYFGEDGRLDTEQLHEDAEEAIREHGLARFSRFTGGGDGGARETPPAEPETKSWAAALRG